MDTFYEQLITIKKTSSKIALLLGIWILAALICILLVFVISFFIGSLTFLAVFGVLFGTYKLCGQFNIEYEYIITNGTLDIDKIINKKSRKRILSLELSKVTRLEKYKEGVTANINPKDLTVACNKTESDTYFLVAEKSNSGSYNLIFAPNERMREAIAKFVPKFISNSAFK